MIQFNWHSASPFLVLFLVSCVHSEEIEEGRRKRSTTECSPGALADVENFNVFLTVSSLASSGMFGGSDSRKIELNWTPRPGASTDDWVGLFRTDPEFRLREPLVKVLAIRHGGYFKTDYRFPQNPMLGLNSPMETCLFGYWIGYISDNRTVKVNCLKLRPHWMWDEREVIEDIPVHALMIPGSHNAGSYKVLGGGGTLNILDRYSINQGEDIWTQLLYGIRYLDIRVAYYEDTPEKFWIVHNFVRMNPLYMVLQDVRKFLQSTKEILIVDFHRFPYGFEEGDGHGMLVRYLDGELGDFMAPDWMGRDVTPGRLWAVNKTLILTYSHDPSSAYNDKIWSEVRHAWGNKKRPDNLKRFLNRAMNRHYMAKYPWAAMAHLTPSALDVIMNPNGGLAKLSDTIAREINRWFREDWWNSANLVATDYILGNNLIEESLLANRKRKLCRDFTEYNAQQVERNY